MLAFFVAIQVSWAQDPNLALDEPKAVDEKKFLQWLKSAGVHTTKVDIANFTNPIFTNFKLRGVKATEDIKAGQELLAVPGDIILSSVNALASPISAVFTENPQLFTDEQVLLSVFLMHELQHAGASKWQYLLKVFPTRFHTSCEFSDAELRSLEGSPVYQETKARKDLFTQEYEMLYPFLAQKYPHFFDFQRSTFTSYKYARLLVQTRAFGMHLDGRTVLGIVPFGDMFNHDPRAKIAWKYDHSDNVFRMYTEQAYAKNTQIFNNYGPRSNRRTLLDFGFVTMDNPFDFVEMPVPVSSSMSLEKTRMLTDRGLEGKRTYTVHLGEVPDDLMFAARLARATPPEVESYKRSLELAPSSERTKVVPKYNASISVNNEIAALSWLQDTAHAMLGKYRTTYEEDVIQLEEANDLPRSAFNSLILNYCEKRIYKFLEGFADVHVPLLNYYAKFQTASSLSNSRVSLVGAEYMRNVLLPLQRSMLEQSYAASQALPTDQASQANEPSALQAL